MLACNNLLLYFLLMFSVRFLVALMVFKQEEFFVSFPMGMWFPMANATWPSDRLINSYVIKVLAALSVDGASVSGLR